MDYTKEQQQILKDVYKYDGAVSLTQEEKDILIAMFENPQSFVILRKILNIFTNVERDIVLPSEEIGLSEEGIPADFAYYGQKVYVNALADEKIRKNLLSTYSTIKAWKVSQKEEEFAKEAEDEKKEEEVKEQIEEEQELAKQRVGENV